MLSRIAVLQEKLRTGLWPIPLAMLVLALLLFWATTTLDASPAKNRLAGYWWLQSGTGDDARNLLSTLVTAIITMASVVFSMTLVTMSLAANQFGSRLVRAYMTDIRTKLTLGLFTMTVVYCLLALRSVEKDMPSQAVPHATVTIGLVLGLVCVLVLLFFLHLASRSIVADEVIQRVSEELEMNLAGLPDASPEECKETWGDRDTDRQLPEDFERRSKSLLSSMEGYLQAIEYKRLVEIAAQHELVLRLDYRAGGFVCKGARLGAIYPADEVDPSALVAVEAAILIGRNRTPTQDVEFSVRHLVDIALRALSPGINDANTALVVIDHLGGALARLAGKALSPGVYYDKDGVVRVVGERDSYASVLEVAFRPIRQAAGPHTSVILRLLDAIGGILEHVSQPGQREALLHHARMIARAGLDGTHEPHDCGDIDKRLAAVERQALSIPPRGTNFGRPAKLGEQA
jgi:uncharacterized membrane protein